MNKKLLFVTLGAVIIALSVLTLAWSPSFFGLVRPKTAGKSAIEGWLVVDGLVEHPLNLTFEELTKMEKTTIHASLYCVDYPDVAVASGSWAGVRLSLILERAQVSSRAIKVAFYADDGFSTDLTIETTMRQDVILAYEQNGQVLTEKLRLVVPGKWGYKWIGNLSRVELVDYDFRGFFESRGYTDDAEIKP